MAHLLHSFGTMEDSWDYCGKGACRLCLNSTIELVSMFQTSHYAVNVLCSLRTICLLLLTPSLAYAIDVAGVTNTVGVGMHAVRCYREDPRPSGDVPMGVRPESGSYSTQYHDVDSRRAQRRVNRRSTWIVVPEDMPISGLPIEHRNLVWMRTPTVRSLFAGRLS